MSDDDPMTAIANSYESAYRSSLRARDQRAYENLAASGDLDGIAERNGRRLAEMAALITRQLEDGLRERFANDPVRLAQELRCIPMTVMDLMRDEVWG